LDLASFEKNPKLAEYHVESAMPPPTKNSPIAGKASSSTTPNVGVVNSDYVTGKDGGLFRMILHKVTAVNLQSTPGFEIGVKLDGIPITNRMITRNGEEYDLILPVGGHMVAQDTVLYTNNLWDKARVENLVNRGLANLTLDSITKSVIEKSGPTNNYWMLDPKSTLVQYTLSKYQDSQDINNVLVAVKDSKIGNALWMTAEIGAKMSAELIDIVKALPFHNPNTVSATLHRLDGRSWSDPNVATNAGKEFIGVKADLPHMRASSSMKSPDFIRIDLRCEYSYFDIQNIQNSN